jgi:hypothetical protein
VAEFDVIFYQERGSCPAWEWLAELVPDARSKCLLALRSLARSGPALRRPRADRVLPGMYELRIKHRGLNLRLLYFFHRRTVVVIVGGFAKQQSRIPLQELRAAVDRRTRFESDPVACSVRRALE